ncbi:MAG: hydroxyisourate hydrolase [Myxococcaceae bacterium]|nr:hydroxyisourate hydrolase [Myxococcaceae bacterium]
MGLSTHILDTSKGRPAANVEVRLSRLEGTTAKELVRASTDADGRVKSLIPDGQALQAGTYALRFDTAAYWRAQGLSGFYPHVDITFTVERPTEHHHVPLLLNPFGFSTYRGS